MSSTHCPLLDIPIELRYLIWEQLLVSSAPGHTVRPFRGFDQALRLQGLGLLATSRQIRVEAIAALSKNVYNVNFFLGRVKRILLDKWLRAAPKYFRKFAFYIQPRGFEVDGEVGRKHVHAFALCSALASLFRDVRWEGPYDKTPLIEIDIVFDNDPSLVPEIYLARPQQTIFSKSQAIMVPSYLAHRNPKYVKNLQYNAFFFRAQVEDLCTRVRQLFAERCPHVVLSMHPNNACRPDGLELFRINPRQILFKDQSRREMGRMSLRRVTWGFEVDLQDFDQNVAVSDLSRG